MSSGGVAMRMCRIFRKMSFSWAAKKNKTEQIQGKPVVRGKYTNAPAQNDRCLLYSRWLTSWNRLKAINWKFVNEFQLFLYLFNASIRYDIFRHTKFYLFNILFLLLCYIFMTFMILLPKKKKTFCCAKAFGCCEAVTNKIHRKYNTVLYYLSWLKHSWSKRTQLNSAHVDATFYDFSFLKTLIFFLNCELVVI